MIFTKEFDGVLKDIGREFFISDILYVNDLTEWSKKEGISLSEPSQPMKLKTEGNKLFLFMQSEIRDEMLHNVINGLSVRWSMIDNVADPSRLLNSAKKRLAFCFFKEYAKTVKDMEGDELREDEWAMKKMEAFDFFKE